MKDPLRLGRHPMASIWIARTGVDSVRHLRGCAIPPARWRLLTTMRQQDVLSSPSKHILPFEIGTILVSGVLSAS